MVVDAGQQRALLVDFAHGPLGQDPTTQGELLVDARAGLAQYPPVTLHDGIVTAIQREENGLFRATVDGAEISVEQVVLATGSGPSCLVHPQSKYPDY